MVECIQVEAKVSKMLEKKIGDDSPKKFELRCPRGEFHLLYYCGCFIALVFCRAVASYFIAVWQLFRFSALLLNASKL